MSIYIFDSEDVLRRGSLLGLLLGGLWLLGLLLRGL